MENPVQRFESAAALVLAYRNAENVLANAALLVVIGEELGFVDESFLGKFSLPLETEFTPTVANNQLGIEAIDSNGDVMENPEVVTLIGMLMPNDQGKVWRMGGIADDANMSVTTLYVGSAAKPTRRTMTIRRTETCFEVEIA